MKKAANNGLRDAMKQLAKLYLQGEGVQKDPAEGEKWLRRAAEKADPFAMNDLSKLLMEKYPDRESIAEAWGWSKLAVAQSQSYRGSVLGTDASKQLELVANRAKDMGIFETDMMIKAKSIEELVSPADRR